MSPRSGGQQSPLYPHLSQQGVNSSTNNGSSSEIQRLRDDLIATRNKLSEWEGVYTQAKCVSINMACCCFVIVPIWVFWSVK